MWEISAPVARISPLDNLVVGIQYRYPIKKDVMKGSRNEKTELLRGTLHLMILRTLELQPLHGSAIMDRIRQVTGGTFDVPAGSLLAQNTQKSLDSDSIDHYQELLRLNRNDNQRNRYML